MANFNFNKAILGGRLTADPELKQTTSGISVCSFSLAVNRKFQKEGEQQVDFINCVAWRNTAEFISRYFKKGSSLCIVGNIQTRSWTDNNGQKRFATEVIVDEASFVDGKNDTQGAENTSEGKYMPNAYSQPQMSFAAQSPQFEEIPNDESLPF